MQFRLINKGYQVLMFVLCLVPQRLSIDILLLMIMLLVLMIQNQLPHIFWFFRYGCDLLQWEMICACHWLDIEWIWLDCPIKLAYSNLTLALGITIHGLMLRYVLRCRLSLCVQRCLCSHLLSWWGHSKWKWIRINQFWKKRESIPARVRGERHGTRPTLCQFNRSTALINSIHDWQRIFQHS